MSDLDERARSLYSWDARLRMLEELDHRGKSLSVMASIIRSITFLHKPMDPDGAGLLCRHCTSLADEGIPWPCKTIQIVVAPEAGDDLAS